MDGFGLRLRQAREQAGWSQETLAKRTGLARSTVCRIEEGSEPSLRHALGLQEALSRAIPDLNLVNPLTCSRGTMAPTVNRREVIQAAAAIIPIFAVPMIDPERLSAPALDTELLDGWQAQTDAFASQRLSEPPRELLPKLYLHLRSLEARMGARSGSEDQRRRLLSLVAGTSALSAWVALMAELRQDARAHLDRGEAVAREVGDNETLALLLMLRADLLSGVPTGGLEGYPALARRHLQEALALTGPDTAVALRVPIILRAAEEAAYVGDATEARRLLAQGTEEAAAGRTVAHRLRPRWAAWMPASFAGSAYQLLGQPRQSLDALAEVEASLPNHAPLLFADRGAAHAQAGDLDAASAALVEAIDRSLAQGHAGAARRVAGVRVRRLARWAQEPAVQRLDERLAEIL